MRVGFKSNDKKRKEKDTEEKAKMEAKTGALLPKLRNAGSQEL